MKESKVLVVNLTGAVTELIRHLVLSGINLEIVNDGKLVEPHHAQEEFLIDALIDCGKYVFLSLSFMFIDKHCHRSKTLGNEPICFCQRYNNHFDRRIVGLCLLYRSPSPRDRQKSRMPSSA